MIELFIEGKRVDVNETFSTMISFAIDDVKDFSAKNTAVSKTVILPGTKNNNLLFGDIYDASISNDYDSTKPNTGINFNASVSASIYVFNDNLQVMKGIMQMLEIIVDDGMVEYEVGLFGELAGFTAKLGNLKLEDLDFSAYDHTYSIANIIASRSNLGSSYIYPNNIDYGTYSTAKHHWKIGTMRPALFIKEYIDKIFAVSGYTYNCDLFNTNRFKRLVVPNNTKILQRVSTELLNISSSTQTINDVSSPFINYFNFPILTYLGGFVNQLYLSNNCLFKWNLTNPIFGSVILKVSLNFTKTSTDPIILNLYKNNDTTPVFIGFTTFGTGVTSGTAIIDYTFTGVSLIQNDNISIVIDFAALPFGGHFTLNITNAQLIYNSDSPITTPYSLGDTIEVNNILPQNYLQKDFISSIVKLFQLYIFEDPTQDKVLLIAPFIDFFNLATSIDWSNKIDRSKPIKLKPMSELNARYYEFNFKKDSDYWNELYEKRYNETYGSYKYDSAYEFAKETEKLELIFSGTPLVGYTGEDKVYSTIFKRSGTTEENIDSNIRILQTKLVTGVSSWNILATDGTTVLGTYTDYLYAGHLDDPDAPTNDLNFGVLKELFFVLITGALNVNQFNVYWSSYMAEITDKDSRLLTATLKLNYNDVANLDFSKLIYIDGSLYRLNKIEDFNASEEDTCTCSFVKVINKIY